MRLTLLESDRTVLRSAEWAALSIVAHATLVWLGVSLTQGGSQLPADEREARVFFLLPPDRVDAPMRQLDIIRLGRAGADIQGGGHLALPGLSLTPGKHSPGDRRMGEKHGIRGEVPFGPPAFLTDSAFSVLDVDQVVERYEGTAAPIYPKELVASGAEGQVQASYVVDAAGRVDTTTITVLQSDHPLFTASVRTALGEMRFRPAKRGGHTVRQLVQQRFRFRIMSSSQASDPTS